MEPSIREAKAHLAEAASAAARGDRVVVTKHDHPFVGIIPVRNASGMDFAKADAARRDLGLDGLHVALLPGFGDAAFSCQALGLDG